MSPEDAGNTIILLGIPILLLRLLVGMGYEKRASKAWTLALPTGAVLVLFVRVAIQRNLEGLIAPQDWISVATWAGIVISQAIATVYSYFPVALFRGR